MAVDAGVGSESTQPDPDPAAAPAATVTVTAAVPTVAGAQAAPNDSYVAPVVNLTVPHSGHATATVSCIDGYYVRPAPPPAEQPGNGLGPSIVVGGDDKWVKLSSFKVSDRYGGDGVWQPFKTTSLTFYNASADHAHTIDFSWWCDAIGTSESGQSEASPAIQAAPVPPKCYYCGYGLDALVNVQTGMALNNSKAAMTEGNPIITWASDTSYTNQHWNYQQGGFLNRQPTYQIWSGDQGVTTALIVQDQTSDQVNLHLSSGGAPDGGNWYYQSLAPGPHAAGAVVLINTSGDGNQCLTAGPNEGDQVTTVTCNMTDQSQWWVETQHKS